MWLRWGQSAGRCEFGNENSSSVNGGDFHEWVRDLVSEWRYCLEYICCFWNGLYYKGNSNEKRENLYKIICCKILQCCPHHVLHTSSSVAIPRQKKSSGCASSPLPPHPILRHVNVQRLLGVKRGENSWTPNLVNMADGVTAPVSNSGSVSRYGRLHDVSCYVWEGKQNTGVLFEFLA